MNQNIKSSGLPFLIEFLWCCIWCYDLYYFVRRIKGWSGYVLSPDGWHYLTHIIPWNVFGFLSTGVFIFIIHRMEKVSIIIRVVPMVYLIVLLYWILIPNFSNDELPWWCAGTTLLFLLFMLGKWGRAVVAQSSIFNRAHRQSNKE